MHHRTGRGRAAALLAGLASAGVLLSGCTTATEGAPTSVPDQLPVQAAPRTSPGHGPGAGGGAVSCSYQSTPDDPAPAGKSVALPDPREPRSGTTELDLHTSAGDIQLTLNRSEAPCTVGSFVHLAQAKFFDGTQCHRLTDYASPPLKVLQCGDPTATGTGGPGYTIPDELPTNLAPAADSGGEQTSVYPAGSVAMANTGQPDSGGSQFFLVYGDSDLPPDYAVFGTVGQASLATLNRVAAAGITPGTDPDTGQPNPQDGTPVTPVLISTVTGG